MTEPVRVPCILPLTAYQLKIAQLLADDFTPKEVAAILKKKPATIEFHIVRAARRIPGTLPRTARIVAWYRGASMDILVGTPISALKRALMKSGMARAS